MRLPLLSLVLLAALTPASAQGVLGDDGIYVLAETPPAPVGGMAAIADAIVYPDAAIDAEAEGTVVLMFVVQPDGSLADVTVARAPHPALGDAALAALASVGYTPGLVADAAVPTRVSLPLRFVLPEPVADAGPEGVELDAGLGSSPAVPIGGWERLFRTIDWPDEAAGSGVEGVFTIAVDVDEQGHVANAEIVASDVTRDEGRLDVIARPRRNPAGQLRNVDSRPTVSSVQRAMEQAILRTVIPQRFVPEVRDGDVVAGRALYTFELYIPGR
ncbi:TonB family protein [Rubrivirga sp. IMCC45206]|uniref:TonB family protein n=1 Tax=Rubrivirga sp. IMCC45206 TaxID=3391614 RepID=UPI00398FC7B0